MEWPTQTDITRYRSLVDAVTNSGTDFSNGVDAVNLPKAKEILRRIYHIPAIPTMEFGEKKMIPITDASEEQVRRYWQKEMRNAELALKLREKDATPVYNKTQRSPSEVYKSERKRDSKTSLDDALARLDENAVRSACDKEGIDFIRDYGEIFGYEQAE